MGRNNETEYVSVESSAANNNNNNGNGYIGDGAAIANEVGKVEEETAVNNCESLNRFNSIIQLLPLRTRLTISSLCLLDNVSTQMLRFLLFNANSPQVLAMFTDAANYLNSSETETFQVLLQLFKQVRLIYNARSPLLNVHDVAPGLWFPNSPPPLLLRGHEAFIIAAIRKTNLLTFILTTLNCFNYGFDLLQNTFLDIFCPNTLYTGTTTTDQNGKFLKSQAILYLDLKTQAYISGLKPHEDENQCVTEESVSELLDIIFPNDLPDKLVARRTGAQVQASNETLTTSERDFIDRCIRRKENLSRFSDTKELGESYDWNHFIKELLDYCNKNMGLIIWGQKGRGKSPLFMFDTEEFDPQVLYASGAAEVSPRTTTSEPTKKKKQKQNKKTMTAAEKKMATTPQEPGTNASQTRDHTDVTLENVDEALVGGPDSTAGEGYAAMPLDPTDRSKRNNAMTEYIVNAAVAASGTNGIKKLKSKRTWSKDEEDALVEGLRVVGSSWSKILDLYGPGGKVSESLKNRTQVQLKDKARNWKLQYLKNNRELPEYLIKVTGNLENINRSKKKAKPSALAPTPAPAPEPLSTLEESQIDDRRMSEAEMLDPAAARRIDQDPSDGLFDGTNTESAEFDPNLETSM
ncbi:Tbf1p KNAG_0J01470 [Huiozyma naganishii CBS 8797]|uniref:Uncharacterized protein n=1 Tax=Huiozyma naganishii (strain ATCC MYA-139 / BCRC 22969 / CBS 8797 / KCTC 17520 / NBRC 10181 / NCYC 3082 / Yp74L-3) TaxID=1071383 RepID=J7RQX5_HUIN7|nr:hypothetical protein KNAG_0J01470 [Kazachstania naganishii CBS 8797]CCK72228.1 hypothetical protein KNAG_0J01470 [Kazachstania naganishii CBS 8797]